MAAPQAFGDVALFVDWENLKRSLNKTGREPNVSSLRDMAEQFGRVVIANAYADWQDPWHQDDPFRLYAAGIQPVYVPTVVRHGEGGASSPFARRRNSVDVKIAAECIECCFKYSNVRTFILASGDGDFVHVVNTLRPYGKVVIAVGVSWSTSVQLAESVDRLLYYDHDIEPVEPPAESAAQTARSEEEEGELQQAFERVLAIIRSSQRGDRALLSWIKHELIKRYGAFDEKRWGFPQFKAFMREAEARGLLKIVEIDLVNWALLPEAEDIVAPTEERVGRAEGRAPAQFAAGQARDRLIQFSHAMEMRYPYISFTFLLDRIMEAELFPYAREEVASILNDAVEDMIFLHSSMQDNRTGTIRTIRTIALNHHHPDVALALGEAPARLSPPTNHTEHTTPSPSKPGGDSRLAADLKTLSTGSSNPELEYRVGERLYQLGRHAESLEHLRRAVSLAPNQATYHCALIRSLAANRKEDEAVSICQHAARLFEDHGEVHQLLGSFLSRQGQYPEAIAAYERAAELLGAGNEGPWLELAQACWQADRPEDARRALQEGMEHFPESKALLGEWSRLQEADQMAEAERMGQLAAQLASQVGQEDEAIAIAQNALKLSECIYQPYYALGEVYMRRGEWERAADCFEKAVSLSPSASAVYAMRMQLVQIYERLGRTEAAEAMRGLLS